MTMLIKYNLKYQKTRTKTNEEMARTKKCRTDKRGAVKVGMDQTLACSRTREKLAKETAKMRTLQSILLGGGVLTGKVKSLSFHYSLCNAV